MKIAILVDPMGSMMGTADDEYTQHIESFTERLGAGHAFYRAYNPGEGLASGIQEGTDLIIYDYGGMGFGCGDMLASNARAIIRWAQEHPSGLVLVVSMLTWNQQITYELEDAGLTIGNSWEKKSALPNLMEFHPLMYLPAWFLDMKLPAQVFFKPTRKFIAWLSDKVGKSLVIDVGAGVGHLTSMLHAKKVRCFGIDIIPRDREEAPTYYLDATTYNYPKGCTTIIARPCHGSWIGRAITKMIKSEVSEILYIGLEKNVENDLGRFYPKFRKVGFGAGADEESVWVLKSKP